jgi:hypothetical protein
MQTVICLITLMFVNGAYLFISFNMESMIPDAENDKIEEVVISSSTSTEFDPADILDLDILDFAVDELMDTSEVDGSASRSPDLVHDRV